MKKPTHLFSKCIVAGVCLFIVVSSLWSLRIVSRTDNNPAPVLAIICGAGTAELVNCLIKRKDDNKKEMSQSESIKRKEDANDSI